MLLPGTLLVCFLAGCWLYCLTDAVFTPEAEFPGLGKRTWIVLIAATFTVGAIAWLLTRPRRRARQWPLIWAGQAPVPGHGPANVRHYPSRPAMTADEAFARHPASRARRSSAPGRTVPIGPDDDPEFLRLLSERIHGEHREQ